MSRRYVLGGVFAALAIIAWRWGDDAARVARTAYWSRQCLRYAPPSDLVVFEQDPPQIARLMASRAGYRVSNAGEADPPHAWLSPAAYAHIPQSGWAPHVAFMHGRKSASGPKRLVVVEFLAMREPQGPDHTVFFHPRVFAASVVRPGMQVRRNEDTIRVRLAPDERLRLYAGRPDPTDASRFTIECFIGDERGTIEGQLHADDRVTFRPVAGEGLKRRWRTRDRSATNAWWDAAPEGDT